MIRRSDLVIDLKNETAFDRFRDRLSSMGCPEERINKAWEILKAEPHGEYNTANRRVTDPAFAHAAMVMSHALK